MVFWSGAAYGFSVRYTGGMSWLCECSVKTVRDVKMAPSRTVGIGMQYRTPRPGLSRRQPDAEASEATPCTSKPLHPQETVKYRSLCVRGEQWIREQRPSPVGPCPPIRQGFLFPEFSYRARVRALSDGHCLSYVPPGKAKGHSRVIRARTKNTTTPTSRMSEAPMTNSRPVEKNTTIQKMRASRAGSG